jgi:DNA repair exonuclease SbcCD ATPase subunit
MAGLKFDFTIGDENLQHKLDEVRQSVSQTAKVIEKLTRDGFDTSTMESKVQTLETVIGQMENAIVESVEKMSTWRKQAEEAFNTGDYELFDIITKDINEQMKATNDLTKETKLYIQALDEVRGTQEKANDEFDKSQNFLESMSDEVKEVDKGFNKYKGVINLLPASLKRAVTGFKQMTKAAMVFLSTPIGAVIGAVGAAFGALMTYLNGSAEGQMKLAKASGYVKGVFVQVKEGAIQMGKKMLDAFKDPKQAVTDLWNAIKQNLINRLNATKNFWSNFGSMIKNVLKGNWDEVKADAQAMGNAFLDMQTGVEDTAGKIAKAVTHLNEAAQKTSELSVRQRKNDIERHNVEKKIAVIDEKIAENREKMYSTDSSIAEKREAVRQTQELIAQKYAMQIKLAQEELAIARESAALSTNKQEVLDNIADLETMVIKLDAQRQKDLAGLARMSSSFVKQEMQEAQKLIEFKRQILEDENNMRKESYDKRIRYAELAYEKEVDALNKQREEMELMNGGELTTEQARAFAQAFDVAWQKFLKLKEEAKEMEEDAMDDYLIKWGTVEEKRNAIRRKYQKLIDNAGTEGEKLSLGKEMTDALANLDRKVLDSSSLMSKLFSDMRTKSVKELKRLASEGRKLMEFINKGEWDEKQGKLFGITDDIFNQIKNSPDEMKDLSDAIDKIMTQVEAVQAPIEAATEALDELFAAGGDTNLALQAVQKLSNATNKLTKVAEQLNNAFEAIGRLSGDKDIQDFATTMQDVADVFSGAIAGAQTGAAVGGGYGAIIGAVLGGGTELAKILAENVDSAQAGAIESYRRQIVALKLAYDDLNDAIGKAFGQKQSQLYLQEAENLEQQRDLVQRQLEEELDKKNVDQSAVESYEEQLRSLDRQIDATKEKAIDAIIGSDITSAITSFADAYASAWESGEDKATSAKDTVVKLMKDTVKEAIKAATESSGIMAEIRRKLAQYMFDGVLDYDEQNKLLQMADTLQKEIDSEFAWADRLMSGRTEGITGGSQRSLATMSEETGSALEGRFTAFQMSNQAIAESMKSSLDILQTLQSVVTENNGVLGDILTQTALGVASLVNIEKYTKKMSGWGENVEKIAKNTENI